MDIITIVSSLVSALLGGGLITVFTLRDIKKGLKIDNNAKEDDRWSKLCDEQQDQIEKLNERLEKKDARIIELEDRDTMLRKSLDGVRTQCAVAELLKCVNVACQNREPKLGTKQVDIDEIMRATNDV